MPFESAVTDCVKELDPSRVRSPASASDLDRLREYARKTLPVDYLTLLATSNGYEGSVGVDDWIRIWSVDEVIENDQLYSESKHEIDVLLVGVRAACTVLGVVLGESVENPYVECDFIDISEEGILQSWPTITEAILCK